MKTVRIGCGQGFWGDSLRAPLDLLAGPRLDYLVLDYLAEVTMSVLSKQRDKSPDAGFAKDFVSLVAKMVPLLIEKKTKVIANAGGVNPYACAQAVLRATRGIEGAEHLKIAVVQGDEILHSIDSLHASGESLEHLETKQPLHDIRSRIQSANVYLGADPIVAALRKGADIVITGRVADPSLVLAPLMAEFRWDENDWDLLASGIIAGHIVECGAQCSGGNCSYDWRSIPDLATIGYPVIEMSSDGSFVVTKQPGTGGRVDSRSVKEQLIYEIGDPQNYITPDVVADFTSISVKDDGPNRVKVTGAKGRPKPARLKVSISYANGYMAAGTLLYSWPDAFEKASAAGAIVKARLTSQGTLPERFNIECIGANGSHGPIVSEDVKRSAEEVMLRLAAWDFNRDRVEKFTREVTPLVLNGPPGATSYFNAKGQVQEVFAYWPTLVARERMNPTVSFVS